MNTPVLPSNLSVSDDALPPIAKGGRIPVAASADSRCSLPQPGARGMTASPLPGRDQAFTQLELLMAISIIALLGALIFMGLQKSMAYSQSIKCVANLRSIGMAAQLFANEHKGRLLTWGSDTFTPLSPRWTQGLAPTLGNTGLEAQWTSSLLTEIYTPLLCPSTPKEYRFSGTGMTYASNSFTNPNDPWAVVYLQMIDRPSATIYLVDGCATFTAAPGEDITDPGWPPPANFKTTGQTVFFPHQGKCNALFLDWHVESFSTRIPAKYIRP